MENNEMLNQDGGTIHSEQIKEEFYKWFESRGLLAELRSYMRQLMVKALEENNKNGKKKWPKKSSSSPKLQAINLLVVDYLFHEDYFYTVSVFSSEAHILDSLPQYSRYVTRSVQQCHWDPNSLPRFSRQETEDILDTLHLPPSPHQLRQAVECYLAGPDSLLACVVRTMMPAPVPAHSNSNGSMEEEEVTLDHGSPSADVDGEGEGGSCCHQLWSQEMQQLLLMAGLKLTHIHRMQRKWARTIETERQQARREAKEEWQRVMEERLQEERMEIRERQSRMEVREQSLASLAEHLTEVHEDVTQRLSQLQLQNDHLDERALEQENERLRLQQQMRELKIREEKLSSSSSSQSGSASQEPLKTVNEAPQGQSEQRNLTLEDKLSHLQLDIGDRPGVTVSTQTLCTGTVASTQTLEVAVTASTQTVDTEDLELQTSLDQPDPELVAHLEQARRKISELQDENLELRAHILQQRQRIDELTNRAANLSSQLDESQVAVAVLSGRENGVLAPAANAPPPPPMIIAPTFGFRAPQRQGGGEESLFVPRPQQAAPRADGRRRPLRFAFSQHPSPSSEESSPTDEVIHNARARIQQLENESVSIQRNFQDLQNRLFTADSLMFPPLRSSRTSDPVMRVRRSDLGSNFSASRHNYPTSFFDSNRLFQNQQWNEEREESSSDFYDAMRLESLTNSRRLFNQRNIRHFERWKQFKKKFQKHDRSNFDKRNFKAPNSNTSSDDDDVMDVRNSRRIQVIEQTSRNFSTDNVNNQIQQTCFHDTHEQGPEIITASTVEGNQARKRENESNAKAGQEELTSVHLHTHLSSKKLNCSKEEVATRPSKTDIEIDLERSSKLIESVKVLLEAQSIKESATTTLSNGSLAVESLPRDSVNSSLIEVGKTESSVVTVQKVNPNKENKTNNPFQNRCNNSNIHFFSPSTSFTKLESQSNQVYQETDLVDRTQQPDNGNDAFRQKRNPEKVHTSIPESNVEGERIASSNFAATSSDAAELESGERATTSLTSGSDILRELNPSKTNSSSSVMSDGFGENSKQSSDFWD